MKNGGFRMVRVKITLYKTKISDFRFKTILPFKKELAWIEMSGHWTELFQSYKATTLSKRSVRPTLRYGSVGNGFSYLSFIHLDQT